MAISDYYVVQYLLEGTRSRSNPIVWLETGSEAYRSDLNGIALEFASVPSRTGSYFCLSFSTATQKIEIGEPRSIGWFRVKYATEDAAQMAHLMKQLSRAIARQCTARHRADVMAADSIRQRMYKQVLGLQPEA